MMKILVAEDEQDIRELVVDTLFDRSYDVLEARDGREAVQIAKREEIALILMDVMMPGMDGFEAVKILQDNTPSPADSGGYADRHGRTAGRTGSHGIGR